MSVSKNTVLIIVGPHSKSRTQIAIKLRRFLTWIGLKSLVFHGDKVNKMDKLINENSAKEFYKNVCGKMKEFFSKNAQKSRSSVAIYDSVDSSESLRDLFFIILKKQLGEIDCNTIWIESNSNNPIDSTIKKVYQKKRKGTQMLLQKWKSVEFKQKVIKIMVEEGIIVSVNFEEENSLENNILSFLLNIDFELNKTPKNTEKIIFLSRHGQSEYNHKGKIGGDSSLTAKGRNYARELFDFIKTDPHFNEKTVLMCSNMKRAKETVELSGIKNEVKKEVLVRKELNELNGGDCDGMTYEEIKEKMPQDFKERARDKYNYRYPNGESYKDLIQRLIPIVFELERTKEPVLIIGHRAVVRCLLGYFTERKPAEIPTVDAPLHELHKIKVHSLGCKESRFALKVAENGVLAVSEESVESKKQVCTKTRPFAVSHG